MPESMRLLLVEDSADDAQLIVRALEHGGFNVEYTRVDSRDSFEKALSSQPWDLILCDYSLPQFNGLKALEILHESGLDLPFIIVSGSISEEAAITALKAGAHDFLTKDKLARLLPAIDRELREAEIRLKRRQAEESLLESEQRFRRLFNTSPDAILLIDPHDPAVSWPIVDCNDTACRMNGYTREELIGQSINLLNVTEDTREQRADYLERVRKEGVIHMEAFHRHKDGHIFPIEFSTSLFIHQGRELVLGIDRDITERKQTEEALRKTEFQYRTLVEQLPMIVYINPVEQIGHTVYVSPQVQSILGYTSEEWLADPAFWQNTIHPEDRAAVMQKIEEVESGEEPFEMEYRMIARDGHLVWFHDEGVLIRDKNGQPLFWQGLMVDITRQKQGEEALKRQDEELRHSNTELERLYRASESLLEGTLIDLPSLADTIVQTVLREFEHSNCSLFLLNRETKELERLAVQGPYASEVRSARLTLDGPGLAPKCIRTGAIINIPDVSADPNYVSNWGMARSEMVIPLKVGAEVIGALDVQSPDPSAFDANDERLMGIFAERAALALERTRLHEQTLRQLDRLDSLRKIDLAISSAFDLRLLLNVVLEQVQTQLNVDATDVLILQPGIMRLEYMAGRGFRTQTIESSSLRLGEGAAGQCALEKRIVHIANLAGHKEELVREKLLADENFVSYFAVPLISKGDVKGVLEIFSRTLIHASMEWLDFLDALGWQTAIAVDNANLFDRIQRSNTNLQLAYDATIEGWSRAMDMRDKETEGHTLRVTEITLQLARIMGMSDEQLVHIRRGALLHDIGKLGVPDGILLKPDKLTELEWDVMRQHPQLAFEWLAPIKYLQPALEIPYCHHEKWDGTGYPRGLKGELIPLSARIFAVVDVWDALTTDRPYRHAWTRRKVIQYIRDNSGKHFDPQVVELFLNHLPQLPRR